VALGGPLIRPQYTFRSSPGAKPCTDRLTVSPGLPVLADSLASPAAPPAIAASALATLLPPRCCAVISWVVPVAEACAGNANDAVIEPSLPAVAVATVVVLPDDLPPPPPPPPLPRSTSTREPASKPEPLTVTGVSGRTRPGLSVMSGPPPPRTCTPPSVATGFGRSLAFVALPPPG